MKKRWMKESARDFIALGSIPFFILVLARVSMVNNPVYLSQFILAGIVFLALTLIFKSDIYSGLALVVVVFTIIFYGDLGFAIFAVLAYFLIIASLFYLKIERKNIFKGIFFGAIATAISYFLVQIIFT